MTTEKNTELLDKALETLEVDKETRNNLTGEQQRSFIVSQMTSDDLLGSKRVEGESFTEYKERRTLEKLWLKMVKSGKFAWVSVDMKQEPTTGMWMNNGGGTYKKELYGELEHKKEKIEKIKKRRTNKALNIIKEATGRT